MAKKDSSEECPGCRTPSPGGVLCAACRKFADKVGWAGKGFNRRNSESKK